MLLSSKTLFIFIVILALSTTKTIGNEYNFSKKILDEGLDDEKPLGPRLKIYYEGYDPTEEETKKITKAVSFLYFFYTEQLGLNLTKNLKIKIRIFGDFYSYKIYQMGFSRTTTDGAFYSSKFDEAVVWKRKKADVLFKDICHEVSHLMVGNMLDKDGKYFKKRPLWINEGLSEYFENLALNELSIEVNPNTIKLERCRNWLDNDDIIPLKDYFAYDNKEWKTNDNRDNLYQSRTIGWSLIYFLLSQPEGHSIVGKMLDYMVNHQFDGNHAYEAVVNSYTGGVERLEQDWKMWLMKSNHLAVQEIDNFEEINFLNLENEMSVGQDK